MPREIEISNIERNFILEALTQNVRIDGRQFDQFRNLDLEFGEEYGTVTLRLGKTRFVFIVVNRRAKINNFFRVHVQISAEVTKPLEERKFEGVFTIVTELSPIASPAFEVGRYVTRPLTVP